MLAKDESMQQLLTKCTRLNIRKNEKAIELFDELISKFEKEKLGFCQSLQTLVDVIQMILSSIDRQKLWKFKNKTDAYQRQLARTACRLFKYLCQFDAEHATNQQGKRIIRNILQWLRDDIDFISMLNFSQDLHLEIYSCLESYSLVCRNQNEFLDDLFSHSSFDDKTRSTCFRTSAKRKTNANESLSIIDYTTRLLTYLLQSSLQTSSLLINQILTCFLIYVPIQRFAIYLFHHTDFYVSTIQPLLLRNNTDYFVQCIINETAQSQIDSTDRVFIFTHMLNLLAEFVLHQGIEIHSSAFVPTFKHLFDSLVECGTTVPLWYFLKCLSNLLTSSSIETNLLAKELHQIGLINSITRYTVRLIEKSKIIGKGQLIFKQLHYNVLSCCLSIFYNLSELTVDYLDLEIISNEICRILLKSDAQIIRLLSCILYSNLISEKDLQTDESYHHLSKLLLFAISQAYQSQNYHFDNQISLFTLIKCLKKFCSHKQFQNRIGQIEDNIRILFDMVRQFHQIVDRQDETKILLEIIWFLSFDHQSAITIHRNDKYFALLIQIAETNPNEQIQEAAKGILWQLRQTIAIEPMPEPLPENNPSQHIMFSYNHDSKELVEKLCQTLQNAGYRTWIDVENMHGSTLECMAHAIEQASVVIICMSDKYKQSPNCQSEGEYVRRLDKPFIPILLQSKYKPNGWLGMLVGTRLYIDFTKLDFQTNVRRLINEIETIRH